MDSIKIRPISRISNNINAPPSKSYTNRALIIASIRKDKTILDNCLICDDTLALMDSLSRFGISFTKKDGSMIIERNKESLFAPEKKLDLKGSGTGLRFMASFASLCIGKTTLTGNDRLKERPIKDLLSALQTLGVNCTPIEGPLPITITGPTFQGGKVSLPGNISSQFLSSILLISPKAKKKTIIDMKKSITSKPYINITLDIMKRFKIDIINHNYKKFIIEPNQEYDLDMYAIEGDYSSASYFLAAAALLGQQMTMTGLNIDSVQGDKSFINVLEKMGCKISWNKDRLIISGPKKLKAIDINMNKMPDCVPTLAMLAAFADGTTKIKNVANLRLKESDRLSVLAECLTKMKIKVKELEDGLEIIGGTPKKTIIDPHNDHRIAMSFAIAGLKEIGMIIKNPICTDKSFPEFWKLLKKEGAFP